MGGSAWLCVGLLLVVAVSSSFGIITVREESSNTFPMLLTRLVQNLPAFTQDLIAYNPTLSTRSRSSKKLNVDSTHPPAPRLQCFDGLGCLTTGEDFYNERYRAINVRAEPREVVNVTFEVHTRDQPEGFSISALDLSRLGSSFNPERPTKFVIHGFLNGRDMPWLEELIDALLEVGDYNAIYVDWTGGSLGLYSQASANSRLAALEIANFIKHTSINPADVHLIGHSLGAHLAGYTGERVPGLGRITGLDPAEPFFQNMPPSVRLDPSDALLVDVIHTDTLPFTLSGGYGLEQAVGHLDFYPNGGKHQPGCQPPLGAPIRWLKQGRNFPSVWEAVEDALGCNHIRAVELFRDSIRNRCPFVAYRCSSFQAFLSAECFSCGEDGSGCVPLGLHADTWTGIASSRNNNNNGIASSRTNNNNNNTLRNTWLGRATTTTTGNRLYLVTGPRDSPCVFHYQALLEVGRSQRETVGGFLELSILVPNDKPVRFDLTPEYPQTIQPGQSRTFVLQHSADLDTAVGAQLTWTCYHPRMCYSGPSPTRLTLRSIEKSSLRRQGRLLGQEPSGITFCAREEAPMQSGVTKQFQLCHIPHHQPRQTTLRG
uniref:Pancreatic triacylglycerol lipase n=1 Tax=Eriocheir sinensis TaxID=95602 RepID=A0A2S1J5P0_ERISI|nr:pancreatic triacylglycerol lipase [Eriocheir sinensis]